LVLTFISVIEDVAVVYLIIIGLFGLVAVNLVALIDLGYIARVDVTVLLLVN
jgi:hypothetical protein